MSLQPHSYEDIINESCFKHGTLRGKKKIRIHAIEELAAQQLIVLPIVTSPSPLSASKINKALVLVCHFLLFFLWLEILIAFV